jgi:hypothetical protein
MEAVPGMAVCPGAAVNAPPGSPSGRHMVLPIQVLLLPRQACLSCDTAYALLPSQLSVKLGEVLIYIAGVTTLSVCRRVDAGTAAEHVRLLHKACVNIACLEAQGHQEGNACDVSLLQQLCSLTAALLRSVHPMLMNSLCASIVRVGQLLSSHHALMSLTLSTIATPALSSLLFTVLVSQVGVVLGRR